MSNRELSLALQINTQVRNVEDLRRIITHLDAAGENVDDLRRELARLEAAWSSLSPDEQAAQLRTLTQRVGASSTSIRELSASTAQAESSFSRLRSAVIGLGATLGVTFALKKATDFFASAVSGAASLEEQLDKVKAVSGATDAEMSKIAETSKQLGASTSYTATQAAAGFETLARAGLNASESIEALPSVLALAQGSNIGLAESAGFITTAIAGMNLSMSDSARVADVLAKAAASANTDVAGLGQALSYAAPSANDVGLALENTVAIIGKFADAGIDASRAGTALNSILSQFSNPASKFKKELAAIGITTNDFNDALHQLSSSGEAGQKAILAVGQEAGPALKALLAQGMGSLDELVAKLQNAGGSAQKMAATMDGNLFGALRGLSSAWDSVKIALGEPILEPITEQVNRLSSIIRAWVSSGEIHQIGEKFSQMFADMAKSVVDFVKEFSLDEVTGKVKEFGDEVTDKIDKIGASFSLVYNTLATGFSTVKGVILSVAAVVTSAVGEMSEVVAGFASSASKIIPGLDGIADTLTTHAGAVKAVAAAYQDNATQAFSDATDAGRRWQDNISTLTQTTEEHTDAVNANATAVDAEVQAFNAKSQRLVELKKMEQEYIDAGMQDTEAYNSVLKERINLESEIDATVEGKALQTLEAAEADKSATKAARQATKATEDDVKAKKEATKSTRAVSKATKENTEASKENAEAQSAISSSAGAISAALSDTRNKYAESTKALEAFNYAHENWVSGNFSDYWEHLADAAGYADKVLKSYRETVKNVNESTKTLSEKTGDGTLSMRDLAQATHLVRNSVDILNDKSQLDDLKEAIDSAEEKMKDLNAAAKSTFEDLQAELAELNGDEAFGRRLEQQRKLLELEEQLAAARARGSQEEVSYYEKALGLQKQIYQEKEKQYKAADDARNKKQSSNSTGNSNGGFGTQSGAAVLDFGSSTAEVNVDTRTLTNNLATAVKKREEETTASINAQIQSALNNGEMATALQGLSLPEINVNTKSLADDIAKSVGDRERKLTESITKEVEENLSKEIKKAMKGRGR